MGDGVRDAEAAAALLFGDFEEEAEAKRLRVASQSSEARSEGEASQPDCQPAAKRARSSSVGAVLDPTANVLHMTWADLADEEDEILGFPVGSLLFDHCNHRFPNRNAFVLHLRAVGRVHEKPTLRSGVKSPSSTDEYRRMGPAESVEQVQVSAMESKPSIAVVKN